MLEWNVLFTPHSFGCFLQLRRVHIWVSGNVQGVFYRQSARKRAEDLGLSGWVKNLADGRVEGVAEGPQEAVETWLAWCRQGPASARVDAVTVRDEAPTGEAGFRILSNNG